VEASSAVTGTAPAIPGTPGFDARREAALPGFHSNERKRLLTLLLEVWYGRQFDLRESAWSPEKGRPFVETDGDGLFMPAVMPGRDEAILAALHTAGRLAFGSFDRAATQSIFRDAAAGLPGPGRRPMVWATLFELYGDDLPRFQLLFDMCEGLRVDSRVQSLVPNHLSRLFATGIAQRPRPPESLPYYDSALAAVRGALAIARGEQADLDPRLRRLLLPDATIADAFRIANELYRETELPPVKDEEVFQSAYLPGRAPSAACLARAQSGDALQQEAQDKPDSKNRKGAHEEQESDQQQRSDTRFDTAGQQPGEGGDIVASGRRSAGSDGQSPRRPQTQAVENGKFYPEWDYRLGRYKNKWAWVNEQPFGESNSAEADRLTSQYATALKRLKKAIQAQKPTRLAPKVRQFDGDDIDLDAAVAYVSEQHAGMSPQPAIYRRRELRRRDVAVTLLADMSTSILQYLPKSGGRLVDRVRAGVLLFVEAMEEVGDVYSVAGFRSRCSDDVSYFTIKDFDQPLTDQVKGLIGGISGRLATRMGAAIRHATARFAGIESRRRLLLILSDGRPEDYDDGGDRRYLHEDTRMAVKEAVMRGVHPFCITVDPTANQYLPQIFGIGHYLVLDNINSLPKKLPEIYLRLRR